MFEALLQTITIDADAGARFRRVETADGGAEVYGDPLTNLMFTHVSGVAIFGVIVDIARAAGWVILPVGYGTVFVDDGQRAALPDYVPEPIVHVASGRKLAAHIKHT